MRELWDFEISKISTKNHGISRKSSVLNVLIGANPQNFYLKKGSRILNFDAQPDQHVHIERVNRCQPQNFYLKNGSRILNFDAQPD